MPTVKANEPKDWRPKIDGKKNPTTHLLAEMLAGLADAHLDLEPEPGRGGDGRLAEVTGLGDPLAPPCPSRGGGTLEESGGLGAEHFEAVVVT